MIVNSRSRPFRATMLATAIIITLGLITIAGRDVILLLGAQYCSLPIVRFAIEIGANPNALNGLGRPLHHALRCSNNPDLVKFLLTHGADANAPDRNRHRPLWMASAIGDRSYVQLLIQRGARVNPQDPNEMSPLTVAAMNDNVAVTRLLLGAGARVHGNDVAASDLHFAAMGGAAEVIPLLVDAGLDIDGVDQYGETPLFGAAVDSARSLRALLAAGAHVNVRNLKLSTPLIAAVRQCRIENIHLLLAAGADPTIRDQSGKNARDYAVHADVPCTEQARLLDTLISASGPRQTP